MEMGAVPSRAFEHLPAKTVSNLSFSRLRDLHQKEVRKVASFRFASDVLLDVSDYYVILTLTICGSDGRDLIFRSRWATGTWIGFGGLRLAR